MKALISGHSMIARFVRFLGVGVLNTGFGYAVFAALVLVGVDSQPALAVAYALGIIWNYMTHARLVFNTTGLGRMLPYAAAYGVIYALNAFALHLAEGMGLSPFLAQALLILPMAVLSFILISAVLTGRVPFMRQGARLGRYGQDDMAREEKTK